MKIQWTAELVNAGVAEEVQGSEVCQSKEQGARCLLLRVMRGRIAWHDANASFGAK